MNSFLDHDGVGGRTEPGSRYHELHELWWEVAEADVLDATTSGETARIPSR